MSISLIGKPLPSSTVASVQELRDWLRGIGQSGVQAGAGGEFAVTHSAGLVLSVATGRATVDGIFCRLNEAGTVTLATADATNPRIDRVVLRLDPAGNGAVSVEVRTGTPAVSPVAPALTQSVTGVWEIPLLSCTVAAAAAEPTSLVDERQFYADLFGVSFSDESGTAYTFGLSDGGRVKRFTAAGAVTVTVPANSAVAFPVGSVIEVYSGGAGGVSIVPDTGVTLYGDGVSVSAALLVQFRSVVLTKHDTNVWVVEGAVDSVTAA